ncbi:MAG: hypothetical protein LBV72_12405 [Tannerella sp.]|jgi:hypothetical protein|nr:hypothetical protein [Tannerella sp.]
MEKYRVILVVDRAFGERLQELPKETPIWIVDTEINKPFIHARWAEKYESHLVGLTSFRDKPEFMSDALAASMIDIIDEHHGEISHNPPFSQLTIIGASLTILLQETLEDFGFRLVISDDNILEYAKEDNNT